MSNGNGVHVVVPDMIGLCANALLIAQRKKDTRLHDAAVSVRSALVLHLDQRYAVLPEEIRRHYTYVIEQTK